MTGGRQTLRHRRMTDGVLTRNIVSGVHRLSHAGVNCYLLEETGGGRGITVVDTAHPSTWPLLLRALAHIDRAPADVGAVVLTHAHFDHLGFVRRAHEEWGAPVWLHPEDRYIAAHPYRYAHEQPRSVYPIRHPRAIPALVSMVRAGALRVPGIDTLDFLQPGQVLDVPGDPTVVFSPGHTFGHSALFIPAVNALISGDALVTFNPYTGGLGPQIVSGAATADSALALASLDVLAATDARTVLPGHGDVWRNGIESAVKAARQAGRS